MLVFKANISYNRKYTIFSGNDMHFFKCDRIIIAKYLLTWLRIGEDRGRQKINNQNVEILVLENHFEDSRLFH